MLFRSCGFSPTIRSAAMYSPNPSGYCGALRPMCHSGSTNSTARDSAASATMTRDERDMVYRLRCLLLGAVGCQRDTAAARGHPDVALHLLMERRAEVSAVEREHADLRRHPHDRAGLARHHEQLGAVEAGEREAVRDVPVLLEIRDVEEHRVADLDAL